jgi:hypothetical protein
VQQPTSPGSSSYGFAWKVVQILSIDTTNNLATVQDQLTKQFTVSTTRMRAKGVQPAVGEQWLVDRQYSAWTFALCLNTPTTIPESAVDGLTGDLQTLTTDLATTTSTAASNTASINFLAVGQATFASYEEQQVFGDKMSTMSRLTARDTINYAANQPRVAMLGPHSNILATGIAVCVATGATGTITAALFSGPSTALGAIPLVASTSAVSTASAGVLYLPFTSGAHQLTLGNWGAVWIMTSGTPGMAGVTFGTNPGILTTGIGNLYPQVFYSGSSVPSTVNMLTSGTMSRSSGRTWSTLY